MKQLIITIIIISIMFALNVNDMLAQIKGEEPPEFNPDTVFIFTSPRPLISSDRSFSEFGGGWGLDLLFSGNGFGGGVFLQHFLDDDLTAFFSLYLSGARNTDEFPEWDPWRGEWRVRNKINRLFMFPVTIGLQKELFKDKLQGGFAPYISAGVGPTFILATPYEKDFFDAFNYSMFYTRFGAFLGIGANLGSSANSIMSVNMRYYYIPFGGDGLESIRDRPLHDFGGVFLSLSLGIKY